ncbi:MAG: bacillithiol biosynthesis BshC [Acidobacteria bacterium]|nr:bacillithiol biosynthesis BshC [Acidobacteriota bacterium]
MPASRPVIAKPVVVTGQQIGAGWSPALSVVKALAALVEAERIGAEAVHWLADEDHDQVEVASVVGLEGGRLTRHRFRFHARPGTAAGWLPWTGAHQREAETLWGLVPKAMGTLRDHALAVGGPLWAMGIRPFSPTDAATREAIQPELERWRAMDLERDLIAQAEHLEAIGAPSPLDPRTQAAWFSLDPSTGARKRLEKESSLPKGHWLSPGAALRPLMQSLMLPVTAAVLGPSERAYWRLAEPIWARVGLDAPRIIARPSVFVIPKGARLEIIHLESLKEGDWSRFGASSPPPSSRLPALESDPAWSAALARRFEAEMIRSRTRLEKLDRRLSRDTAAAKLGLDPEHLRQSLFPFGRDQERVIPGLFWLRQPALLDRVHAALRQGGDLLLVEEP